MTQNSNALIKWKHESVLTDELLSCMKPEDTCICDATIGLGGHSEAIIKERKNCILIGIDADAQALAISRERLNSLENLLSEDKRASHKFYFIHSNFSELSSIFRRMNLPEPDFIFYDLGVSSMQLDNPQRGFSFTKDGPLDMRMNSDIDITAADIVNTYTPQKLLKIFFDYGEEKSSKKIVRAIVERRRERPFLSTLDLAEIIAKNTPGRNRKKGIHPATLIFQALRIAVNNELNHIRISIKSAIELLKTGGRIAVISFHSLEDRIVKEEFRLAASDCICPPGSPVCRCNHKTTLKIITKKPILPGSKEKNKNQRARSAKMRVGEKV